MSSKSMVAVNPQISLTIGNPEMVNMLVQQQVVALQAQLKELEVRSKNRFDLLNTGIIEIIESMDADFKKAYGKKLDAYAKARGALTGHKLTWKSPYGGLITEYERVRHGAICVKLYRSGGYRNSELVAWNERDEAELNKPNQLEFRLVEIPTVAELNSWNCDWRTDYDSKEEAEEAWSEDNSEAGGLYLSLKLSKETIDLIKKYRAIDNEGIPDRSRLEEIRNLLKDTVNIEKAVLAKMTQNTLENNPELVEAFAVLTKGILGLPYMETKQLTIDAE